MIELLGTLGGKVTVDERMSVEIDMCGIKRFRAPYNLVKTMRASFLVMGAMLGRHGCAEVSLPGGCAIGSRPVDQHLKAFSLLGADIELNDGYVCARSKGRLHGTRILLDINSVGATQNVLMAAVLAEGTTEINNAAQEPEVCDLAQCLVRMGARISGIGTRLLTVDGVKDLHGCEYVVMPDRIEAGTYMVAVTASRGSARLTTAGAAFCGATIQKLREFGADVTIENDNVFIDARGRRPKAVDIRTEPYPGIPTDMQAQFMILNSIADGHSTITETIFENRFMHVQELVRLGADISINGESIAEVRGVESLSGANVMATDLRASSCLVIGGLIAKGETVVDRIYHIDRGYERTEEKLQKLGADISRVHSS